MKKGRYTEEEDKFIISNDDRPIKWVAKKLNRAPNSVGFRRRRLGLAPKAIHRFDRVTKMEMIEAYEKGYTLTEITKRYETYAQYVSGVIRQARQEGKLDESRLIANIDINHYPPRAERDDPNKIYALMMGERTIAEGNLTEIAQETGVEVSWLVEMMAPYQVKLRSGTKRRHLVYLYDERELEEE